jgi:hypothetical protein
MPTTVHTPPKIIASNAKDIGRQVYEFRKQLQDFRVE